MKRFLCVMLLFLLALTACAKNNEYRNDLSCTALAEKATDICRVEGGYSAYGDEQIKYFFEDTHLHDAYSLLYSTDSGDINEIGVFHCPDEKSAEELLQITYRYLEDMQVTQVNFISSYAPYEIPKLEGAEARRYGCYVVYAILDTAEQRSAFSAIENELTNG